MLTGFDGLEPRIQRIAAPNWDLIAWSLANDRLICWYIETHRPIVQEA
jgi:hypothetical protein